VKLPGFSAVWVCSVRSLHGQLHGHSTLIHPVSPADEPHTVTFCPCTLPRAWNFFPNLGPSRLRATSRTVDVSAQHAELLMHSRCLSDDSVRKWDHFGTALAMQLDQSLIYNFGSARTVQESPDQLQLTPQRLPSNTWRSESWNSW